MARRDSRQTGIRVKMPKFGILALMPVWRVEPAIVAVEVAVKLAVKVAVKEKVCVSLMGLRTMLVSRNTTVLRWWGAESRNEGLFS